MKIRINTKDLQSLIETLDNIHEQALVQGSYHLDIREVYLIDKLRNIPIGLFEVSSN